MSYTETRFFSTNCTEDEIRKQLNVPDTCRVERIDTLHGTLPVDDKNPEGETFETFLVKFETEKFTKYKVEYLKAMKSCIDALAPKMERDVLIWEVVFEDGDWGRTKLPRKEAYEFIFKMQVFLSPEFKIADSIGMGEEYVKKVYSQWSWDFPCGGKNDS